MNEVLLHQKPVLIRNCRLASSAEHGEIILMPEGMIKLKGTGVEIVRLADGNHTVAEMVSVLCSKFANTDSAALEKDVTDFLKLLQEKRVLDLLT